MTGRDRMLVAGLVAAIAGGVWLWTSRARTPEGHDPAQTSAARAPNPERTPPVVDDGRPLDARSRPDVGVQWVLQHEAETTGPQLADDRALREPPELEESQQAIQLTEHLIATLDAQAETAEREGQPERAAAYRTRIEHLRRRLSQLRGEEPAPQQEQGEPPQTAP